MRYSYHDERLQGGGSNKYALVIFLPHDLDSMISPLRERFDPEYNAVPAHITLVFPFETDCPVSDLSAAIHSALEDQKEFLIQLESLDDFYPKSPIIYWNIATNRYLGDMYYRLYSSLNRAVPHASFTPHVTIAREISTHRLMLVKEKIVSYLSPQRFMATAVDLITPLANMRWVSVRTFPLGRFPGAAL